ncbi:MAG: RNA methyltransferase, partial [Asgard group archaeon]|nr:RNA methyltransferase [Asgard group archaeon]
VVLVEPEGPANIGSVARVMKNFGFKDLVLINPQTSLTGDSYKYAMHAKEILENHQEYDSLDDFLPKVTYVIGTTAQIITDIGSTNARIAVRSDDPSLKNVWSFDGDVAILFGRESTGLTNNEINLCDMTIHIPAAEEYYVLNLAQSVGIILYSLYLHQLDPERIKYRQAKRNEKEKLINFFAQAVSVLGFHQRKEEILVRRFRNIIGRSFVSGKEAVSLMGVFTRTYKRIKQCEKILKENKLVKE